jgi:hypothetical protein
MKEVRYLGLVALFVVTGAGLSGCFSSMVDYANQRGPEFYQPVLTDTILAVGEPDAALAQALGVPHAVAFLGEKNTYLLIEGGEILMQIAAELDGKRIALGNERRSLILKDGTVWGSLSLFFAPVRSPQETTKLTRLGFTPGALDGYQRRVSIKGRLYPALVFSDEQAQMLKQKRPIQFYVSEDSSPPPDLGPLYRPAAIAADVVTLPIQMIGLAAFAITIHGRRP